MIKDGSMTTENFVRLEERFKNYIESSRELAELQGKFIEEKLSAIGKKIDLALMSVSTENSELRQEMTRMEERLYKAEIAIKSSRIKAATIASMFGLLLGLGAFLINAYKAFAK